jgi:ankyrin repeat protein
MSSFPYQMHMEYELIKYLIAQGCDINAKDEKGETALDKAVALKNIRVADLLLEKGAKPNTDKVRNDK